MTGFLIALAVVVIVGWLIVKKYQPHTVLLLAGLFLLTMTVLVVPDASILFKKAKSTGWVGFDIFAYVKESLSYRAAGLGMIIMAAGGFAKYMDHIGATDAMVAVCIKPLRLLKAPYVVFGGRVRRGAGLECVHSQCRRFGHAAAGDVLSDARSAGRQPGSGSGDDRHHGHSRPWSGFRRGQPRRQDGEPG